MNIEDVVGRLLAEGDDVEETLTRVCVALRDATGCNLVTFWPADRHAHVLPIVSAAMTRSLSGTGNGPIEDSQRSRDVRLDSRDALADTASAEPHGARAPGTKPQSSKPVVAVGRAQHDLTFPVRGSRGLLGVITCQRGVSDSPDAAVLSVAPSLGSVIARFIERKRGRSKRLRMSELDFAMLAAKAQQAGHLEGIVEALVDSVLIFDRDGRILHANAADRAMFGYKSQTGRLTSTLRQRGRQVIMRDERGQIIPDESSPIARVLRGETLSGRRTVEVVLTSPDGRDVQASIRGAPIYDGEDKIIGGFVVTQDVGGVRQHERALQEMVRRLDEAMAIAAHDLRTPITTAKGYSQLAIKRLSNLARTLPAESPQVADRIAEVLTNLEHAERSMARLGILVDRLLDGARIQIGKLDVRPEPANLDDIVRTVVNEQQLAMPTRRIRYTPPRTLAVPIRVDAMRIGEVLLNYLTNALKYSPDNTMVEVTLDATCDEARVSVRDEGVGIAPANQERIWSRFEQLDGTHRRRSDEGLGLGLYISRAIVEAHGGQVGVTSAVGRGSTFWFSLPLMGSRD